MRAFLSYRRSDFGGQAEHVVRGLHDGLERAFGAGSAYWDSEIPFATDFRSVIEAEIAQADAVVMLIGPGWAEEFRKRAGTDDHLLYEIETAVRLKVPVVPVLGADCEMVGAEQIPSSISSVSRLNTIALGKGKGYEESIQQLVGVLQRHGRVRIIDHDRFQARNELDEAGSVSFFSIAEKGRTLSYREVLDYWLSDDDFIDFYLSLLDGASFDSYVWETPSITESSWGGDFEFVLLNTPMSAGRADPETYRKYYEPENGDAGIVVFDNLRGDSRLVVPSPLTPGINYGNLASFLREAPAPQRRALWRVVAKAARAELKRESTPTWISVAGGGIQWLHVRLDHTPRYYRHAPYRRAR